MLHLNDLYYFVRAVEHGGFAPAGRKLNLPKSTISKRVAALETRLGTRLIQRTSRSFSLTDAGRAYFEHARAALIEAESAEIAVRSRTSAPSGMVRMTSSMPTAQFYLAEQLPALAFAYPALHVVLHASDRMVDIVQEGFDIAVRSHFEPLPSSGLIQRKVSTEPIVLVAAPSYLEHTGMPTTPDDLAQHHAIMSSVSATTLKLCRVGGGDHVQVSPIPRFSADESLVLLEAAAAGLGFTSLPWSFCHKMVKDRRLQVILPDWHAGEVTTTLLLPPLRSELPSVRVVVEFLVEKLGAKNAVAASLPAR
ncbi:LysR substrate-binding domain-containing protein [Kordiimonas sp.]|uniref:LysR substrate-binding domain-containing protein n=1 Tax=Kordiimonas sp. TaxID=1970157 RepID=UPI003A9243D8